MEPSKAHVIHSFFSLSFPSPLHIHETCNITLHWAKKTWSTRNFGSAWKKIEDFTLLYKLCTWCGGICFSPCWGGVAKAVSKSSGCLRAAKILSLAFPGHSPAQSAEIGSVPPSGRSWEGDLCHPLALYSQEDGKRASSPCSENKIIAGSVSLNSELSVWIHPIWKSGRRIRLSLWYRWDLMVIFIIIFSKNGSNLPFQKPDPAFPWGPFLIALGPLPKCWVLGTGCSRWQFPSWFPAVAFIIRGQATIH